MTIQRRAVLVAAAGVAAMACPLAFLLRRDARTSGVPLASDPARVLDLPAGFQYQLLQSASDLMSDGCRVPGRPDGMACFAGPGDTQILMRNHELDWDLSQAGYASPPSEAFDAKAAGGVTRLVLQASTLKPISSNRVLAGTLRNCGGGTSPWGWLSCEETVEPGHGYVFRCAPSATSVAPAERILGYGRFRHEAACIDPRTQTAYLTEDQSDGCFYRYQPKDPRQPHTSGKLQALRVANSPRFDTSRDLGHSERLEVDWVEVPDPDPQDDSVREQARSAGAARFCRGEGIFFGNGVVYICCTAGGRQGLGQVFQLRLGLRGEADQLELLAESPDQSLLDMPDNIYLAPWGDLLVAEDGAGEQFLRGITAEGRVYDLARNAQSTGEFAGICSSPSGNALFVNLQQDGLTLAITGPFPELRRRAQHFAHRKG